MSARWNNFFLALCLNNVVFFLEETYAKWTWMCHELICVWFPYKIVTVASQNYDTLKVVKLNVFR